MIGLMHAAHHAPNTQAQVSQTSRWKSVFLQEIGSKITEVSRNFDILILGLHSLTWRHFPVYPLYGNAVLEARHAGRFSAGRRNRPSIELHW